MKYSLVLTFTLAAVWLLWSGHLEPFMLALAVASVGFTMWVCQRMKIIDGESVPVQFGIRVISYTVYLTWEIIKSNLQVTRIILAKKMPLQRNMIVVPARQATEIGNVILANSITLTPGTISVSMNQERILVHALNFAGGQEDLSGDMEKRVSKLEGA